MNYGKVICDARLLTAIRKGTDVGKETVLTSWLEHEYRVLERLRAAGCGVPKPLAVGSNTILMEYTGDIDHAALTLHEVRLPARQARSIFNALLVDLDRMLKAGWVHVDLSAYNVLYWQGQGRIIDLPQVVDPTQNADARDIFRRDGTRLCQYFQKYALAAEL